MDEKIIDIPFEDETKQYYTIDEVSKILGLEQSRIIFYHEKLNDFLNITSIGMYQVFEQTDIDNLRKIKELNIDNNMDISETRIYLNSHKQEILLNKQKQELDISNKSFADFLIRVLNNQNQKIDILVENGNKTLEVINQMNEHQEILKTKINSLTNEISEIKNQFTQELSVAKDINKKLEDQSQQIQNNFDENNKIIEDNTKMVAEIKNEFKYVKLEHESEPKGFFSKMFHKKN